MCIAACKSVRPASAGAGERVGVSGGTLSMPEAITPEVVTLECQCVVEVLIRCSWALSIASETTVPLITLMCCCRLHL